MTRPVEACPDALPMHEISGRALPVIRFITLTAAGLPAGIQSRQSHAVRRAGLGEEKKKMPT